MKLKKENNSFLVKMLLNPHRYFLDNVYIVSLDGQYRLLVYSKRRGCVLNTLYPTMRGARIAFTRMFNPTAPHGTVPDWSEFFAPELTGAAGRISNTINVPSDSQINYTPSAVQSI